MQVIKNKNMKSRLPTTSVTKFYDIRMSQINWNSIPKVHILHFSLYIYVHIAILQYILLRINMSMDKGICL